MSCIHRLLDTISTGGVTIEIICIEAVTPSHQRWYLLSSWDDSGSRTMRHLLNIRVHVEIFE